MKTDFLRRLGLCLAFVAPAAAQPVSSVTLKERGQGYREHRILAKPRAPAGEFATDVEARHRLRLRRAFARFGHLRILELDSADSADLAIARLRASGRYEYVERDQLVWPLFTPNDPSFPQQWSNRNTGQSGGTVAADIGAVAAWDTLTSASNIIVAIIDTGIRATHEDLAANLWSNSRGSAGIDATVSRTSSTYYDPDDIDGHGTHVAGIIGAVGNNGIGTAGVAWRTQLMALKFIPEDGSGSNTDEIECIDYAIANGAHVINASFGGPTFSQGVFDALRAARDAGIIVVAAAGNDGTSNDLTPTYPAAYLLDNIVSVASTTRTDALASSSNHGSGSIDLAAPGAEIYSTYHRSNSSYETLSGTSMAAPHVAGAVALLKAKFPADSYRQTINRLLRTATRLPTLQGRVHTGGRLNLARALASDDHRPFNDDFAERALLRGDTVRVRASNTGATAESGEPAHAGIGSTRSLWWTWTPTESTEVSLDTSGSSYDTVLAIYTGAGLDTLQQVGANNDASTNTTASRVALTVAAQTPYHIAVSSRTTGSGLTVLRVGSVPANDSFARARPVTGNSVKLAAANRNASAEPGEPVVSGAAGRSVWYSWVAPNSGRYHYSAFATNLDTVAAVYTGSTVSGLTLVGSNDNASLFNTDALVRFEATAGTTYYLQVDHANDDGTEGGEFTLTLTDSVWEYPAYDQITSSPAVGADGTVYFGAGSDEEDDPAVYAIRSDGTRRWRFATGDAGVIGASPAIGPDGTVYIGGMNQNLYALDGETGARKWSFAAGSPLYATPAIGADGTIYFRDDVTLYALTPAGALKWSYSIDSSDTEGTYCSPVIGLDGTLYIGSTAGKFRALTDRGDRATLKWSYTAEGDIYTTPAIAADGTLYFGTLDGVFYALTPGAAAATKKWSVTLPAFAGGNASISSSPALAPDGTIYFAAYDHRLYALDPASGATKWTYGLGDQVRASSAAVARNGTVYIGAYDGLVYAVRADGTLARTFPTALLIRSSPVIAGNRLYFGSNDAKLRAFDLGQPAAASAWPMFQRDAQRTGRARSDAVAITVQPQSQTAASGATLSLSVAATAGSSLSYQWFKDGAALPSATAAVLTLTNIQPADAGIYTARVVGDTTVTSDAAIVGLSSTSKILGLAREVLSNVTLASNNHTYDQILLEGDAASVTADPGQITRLSFIDLSNDIVQVEFSGAGTLTLKLENSSGPAAPVNYNQPSVAYRKGHARIILSGANETTHVMVYSVGSITAINQALFRSDVTYDGVADIGYLAVLSTNGQLGAIRTANTTYLAAAGVTGVHAPGVRVAGPVYIGDIAAGADALPVILLGGCDDARITGGNLQQLNNAPVKVSGFSQLRFVDGTTSHGVLLPGQANRARLERDGTDVTTQVVVNPSP